MLNYMKLMSTIMGRRSFVLCQRNYSNKSKADIEEGWVRMAQKFGSSNNVSLKTRLAAIKESNQFMQAAYPGVSAGKGEQTIKCQNLCEQFEKLRALNGQTYENVVVKPINISAQSLTTTLPPATFEDAASNQHAGIFDEERQKSMRKVIKEKLSLPVDKQIGPKARKFKINFTKVVDPDDRSSSEGIINSEQKISEAIQRKFKMVVGMCKVLEDNLSYSIEDQMERALNIGDANSARAKRARLAAQAPRYMGTPSITISKTFRGAPRTSMQPVPKHESTNGQETISGNDKKRVEPAKFNDINKCGDKMYMRSTAYTATPFDDES